MRGRIDSAAKLVALRKRRHLSQAQLAVKVGYVRRHIAAIENGRRGFTPSAVILLSYFDRYGPLPEGSGDQLEDGDA